jgi:cytochrome c553
LRLLGGITAILISTACASGSAHAPIAGAELYEACTTCHGPSGEGNAALGAPRIGGLPKWYLASQIKRFQDGIRGKHPDDIEGLRMRAMARQMMNDAEIDAVAAHITTLTPAPSGVTFTHATAEAAAPLYQVCSACHGPKGEGNEALNAPPLAGLDDWYIARQMAKFRAGIRGSAPQDTFGPQMMGMSMAIPPDQIENLAVFVHELAP